MNGKEIEKRNKNWEGKGRGWAVIINGKLSSIFANVFLISSVENFGALSSRFRMLNISWESGINFSLWVCVVVSVSVLLFSLSVFRFHTLPLFNNFPFWVSVSSTHTAKTHDISTIHCGSCCSPCCCSCCYKLLYNLWSLASTTLSSSSSRHLTHVAKFCIIFQAVPKVHEY